MSIAKWTLIFCFGRKPAFPERRLKLGIAPTPISTAALRYDRLTSTPAVAGQRSTAGFSLQVGSDCSSGSVCSEGEDRFERGEVPAEGTKQLLYQIVISDVSART
jgi:hypothetical protein